MSLILPLRFCHPLQNKTISGKLRGPYFSKKLVLSTEEERLQIATGFENRWDFPNCIGAMDGKDIVIQAPKKEGSVYFNYKGNHSIALLALIGPGYRVIYFDVGSNGRISDGGVFNNRRMSECHESNSSNVPVP
ncbi:uncharacterized protein LOC126469779 [Schistocerca serialis cubense]|uniref:uncharacterized protein LOC126469779 n=1 Tax=Schistocerca serialis cubense TaxID=2023355 RepID=UPI00214E6093|nr:uncharacterized protein LOC126469779 [Schistocerca serialis cubense]